MQRLRANVTNGRFYQRIQWLESAVPSPWRGLGPSGGGPTYACAAMRDDHDERSEGDADPLARTMPRDPEDTTSPEASSAFEAADSSEAGSAPEQAGSSDESTHVGRYRLIDKLGIQNYLLSQMGEGGEG